MSQHTYAKGWKRILKRAEIPHVGTHGIRHRATTEIANSGVPVKVGMQLTAHKTVTQFMRYVHTEDSPVRAAAEIVGARRKTLLKAAARDEAKAAEGTSPTITAPPPSSASLIGNGRNASHPTLGAYQPFRHRSGTNRAIPPGTKRADG